MDNEVWKPVVGFPGYEVSNMGRLRSYYRKRARGSGKGQGVNAWELSDTPVLRKPTRDKSSGYRYTLLRKDGKTYAKRMHCLVLEAFVGPRPVEPNGQNYQGAHLNGKPGDDWLTNLKWVTAKENASHKVLHGTNFANRRRGENNPSARFTDEQVSNIKQRLSSGEYHGTIAEELGLPKSYIYNIAANKTWVHIEPQLKGDIVLVRKPNHLPPEFVEDIKSGESIVAVAKRYGVDASRVSRQFVKQAGMSIREYRRSAPVEEAPSFEVLPDVTVLPDGFITAIESGRSLADAARAFNLGPIKAGRMMVPNTDMTVHEYVECLELGMAPIGSDV